MGERRGKRSGREGYKRKSREGGRGEESERKDEADRTGERDAEQYRVLVQHMYAW